MSLSIELPPNGVTMKIPQVIDITLFEGCLCQFKTSETADQSPSNSFVISFNVASALLRHILGHTYFCIP
jgi:hypothetical protein